MSNWKDDKRWSDQFLDEIKSILGLHLIGEPPAEEDAERNTDLMVLRMDAVRIGCRVRTWNYLKHYGHQFTIRSGRPSGAKTELTKIIEGWGDYFFYAFADESDGFLAKWTLADMNVFRIEHSRRLSSLPPGRFPGDRRMNGDHSSCFVAFEWDDYPASFVVASGVGEGVW